MQVDEQRVVEAVRILDHLVQEHAQTGRVLAVDALAPHYQIRVSRDGNLDVMTVQVEKAADAADADVERVASELRKGIKDYVGVSAVIEVSEPGGVERSQGKAVRVIDERE